MLACFFTNKSTRGSLCTTTPTPELSVWAKEDEKRTNERSTRTVFIVNLSGRIKNPGSRLGVSFENYSVNDYKLEGSFSITNNTANDILSFTTQTTNGKLTYPAGLVYTHTGSHTYTQIGGTSTPTFVDDSWSVTGSGSTTSSANENLTVTIKTPLVKSVACGSIVSGEQSFQYNNILGSLNFGEGACDRLATLKIGSYTAIVNF